jgi:membrane dipeptidase
MSSILSKRPIVDAHCDTWLRLLENGSTDFTKTDGHIDLERLLASPVGIQVFALFTPPKWGEDRGLRHLMRLLNLSRDLMVRHRQDLRPILTSGDVDGPGVGVLLAVEGLDVLGEDLDLLELFFHLGVRSAMLTWNGRNRLADGATNQESGGGLSRLGRQVIRRMVELGMVVDVSHLAERAFWDVLDETDGPLMASHSNAKALCDHPRNLTDAQLRALGERGGVIGINFYSQFLVAEGESSSEDLLRHMAHVLDVAGPASVGFGSDWDGIESWPVDVAGVAGMAGLAERVNARFGESAPGILGDNFRRLFRTVLPQS